MNRTKAMQRNCKQKQASTAKKNLLALVALVDYVSCAKKQHREVESESNDREKE